MLLELYPAKNIIEHYHTLCQNNFKMSILYFIFDNILTVYPTNQQTRKSNQRPHSSMQRKHNNSHARVSMKHARHSVNKLIRRSNKLITVHCPTLSFIVVNLTQSIIHTYTPHTTFTPPHTGVVGHIVGNDRAHLLCTRHYTPAHPT